MSLSTAGVSADRIYNDKLSGASTREQRPGLAALLDHARQATRLFCVGIDSLGRNAAEVMTTIRDLRDRDIVLRSLTARASRVPSLIRSRSKRATDRMPHT
jgi:DNA invertase Pin-like site-specific DNA recombinase